MLNPADRFPTNKNSTDEPELHCCSRRWFSSNKPLFLLNFLMSYTLLPHRSGSHHQNHLSSGRNAHQENTNGAQHCNPTFCKTCPIRVLPKWLSLITPLAAIQLTKKENRLKRQLVAIHNNQKCRKRASI